MSKSLEQFISEYEGQTVGYPEGKYVGECLSLVKHYILDCFEISPPPSGCNAARCYWSLFPDPLGTVFKKIANTADLIPEAGWIAIWDKDVGNGCGHIAIVLSATITKFTSLDQNWEGKAARRVSHNYDNVSGFLAPLQSSSNSMPENSDYEKARLDRDHWWNNQTKLLTALGLKDFTDENIDSKVAIALEKIEASEKTKTEYEQFKQTMKQRLETLAQNLFTIIDWDEVVNASARFKTLDEKNQELSVELDKEQKAKKKVIEGYEENLTNLKEEMTKMKEDHASEIAEMQINHDNAIKQIEKKVDKELAELTAEKEKYKFLDGLINWIKSILPKKQEELEEDSENKESETEEVKNDT